VDFSSVRAGINNNCFELKADQFIMNLFFESLCGGVLDAWHLDALL
jgi:hypothetical protein